jgi:hypothetical protein
MTPNKQRKRAHKFNGDWYIGEHFASYKDTAFSAGEVNDGNHKKGKARGNLDQNAT